MSKCFDCGDDFKLHAHNGGRCIAGNCDCPKFNEFPSQSWKLKAEIERLNSLINVPHTGEWHEAVTLEAAHQIGRWGVEHDRGKDPTDWIWLLGFLAGKAVNAAKAGDLEKAKHHTISSGAMLLNWHRHLSGVETTFQPGEDRVYGSEEVANAG